MANSGDIRQWLSEVKIIDDQAETLERAVNALEECTDATLVDDVLAVFERCSGQDDYGMFSSLAVWMDHLPEESRVGDKLRESLGRRPSWKVIEMLPGYCSDAADLLEQVLKAHSFDDPRYDDSWIEKRISELRANA